MTWEELKYIAKQAGYWVTQDGFVICQEVSQVQKIFYYEDGVINVKHYDNSCIIAKNRTPKQMYQIMSALRYAFDIAPADDWTKSLIKVKELKQDD